MRARDKFNEKKHECEVFNLLTSVCAGEWCVCACVEGIQINTVDKGIVTSTFKDMYVKWGKSLRGKYVQRETTALP